MGKEIEKRTFNAELRLAGDKRKIVGYAAKFNSESRDLGGFIETIKPGAFRDSLQRDLEGNPVMAFWNHETSMPLGSTQNGTLKLREDSTGLWFECNPPKTSWSKDVRESISSGLITGCSFGFQIEKDKWRDGGSRRELVKVNLHEISPCSMPAYPETSVDVRKNRRLKMATIKEQAQRHCRQAMELHENLTNENIEDYLYHCDEFDKLAPQFRWPTFRDAGFDGVNTELSKSEAPIVAPLLYGGTDEFDDTRARAYGTSARSNEKGPFKSFGEQLLAIRSAGSPGGMTDQRLFEVRSPTGLNEGIGADGGFLIQNDFSTEIFKRMSDAGKIAGMCKHIPISGNSNSIKMPGIDETSRATGSRWGGVRGFWLEESGEKVSSKPKFRQMELNLHKVIALIYGSDELLNDSSAMESVIKEAASEELAFLVDDAVINGDGVGKPAGILNSSALVTASKQSGQSANTLVWENILDMWVRMPARNRANAAWLINQDIEAQLYSMALVTGTGGVPVYLPAGQASATPYSTLFGRPVVPIEQCQTLGTKGDIILADLSQYLLINKGGIDAQSSIHIRFVYDETCFRFVYRVDGQSLWAAPMTPFKGSNSLSPFVTLETRA